MSTSASSLGPLSSTPVQVIHCSEELRQTLRVSTSKRKKKPTLNSYSRTSKQSVQQRQHTQYCVHDDGSITYARRYIEPPKNAQLSQPLAWEPLPGFIPDLCNDFTAGGLSSDDDITSSLDNSPKKKILLLMWLDHRSLFLEELLRLEGRGDLLEAPCSHCGNSFPKYQCQDCFGIDLRCLSCITAAHQRHPLHRLQKWNSNYFEHRCPNPHRSFNDDFVVMDSYGIHEVLLDFCNCVGAGSHVQQLLRVSWFPSTTADPKTAATFCLLDEFHLLSFESKVLAYKFYSALARRTDNTGLTPIKDRYESFMRMIREWRHLMMLKCSGRGHDPKGIDATEDGDCAVLCPACPHPGKNLPDDWEQAPRGKRWIYALFVAIDANFHLKCKVVSSDTTDPSLSHGLAYFVEESAYKKLLAEKTDVPQEKSTCASHNAVNMADTKTNWGLAATGLGTIDCARHNMKRPNAVGDLQKGEKYINMDYLFFNTPSHLLAQPILSYRYILSGL
ncbi:uncharacterized protein HD556DRAFT_1441055 [Suillus plorans]|uniref:CxC2-like cysteine cluster KDZ transposase-associated domain-containing protein n=1 Tax=Suillus plorans TaxID=116603 RepID=A0A9P7IYV8_9AGAM|nr:uncharacterized protein HD556DRAFT_1441055 [Suillus plorans]KAG1797496.1 hypothetical protein HD556DRAFT_1441055 [Suillus plorans]